MINTIHTPTLPPKAGYVEVEVNGHRTYKNVITGLLIEDELNPSPTSQLQSQISSLKTQLESTDYQAIKYAEGWMTGEEYAPIKAQRQAWRDEINELEVQLNAEA